MDGCPDDDTLAALLAGTLSEEERAKVANHAAGCEACHAVVAGIVDGADGGDGGDDAQQPLRPGAMVGRYRLESRLGSGGMGVVYAAVDTELQRRVAVKVLRGGGGQERLMREARTLARLTHPNVVTVFDVGVHRGQLFVAMELVEGGSLGAWLAHGPRPLDEVLDRMVDAGRGLAAAHAAGVVHRDVKPDNILVGDGRRVRVTDFGLAHEDAGSRTRTGVMGTPAYMAPEQRERGESTVLTDQWSYCATLYEAVAGVRPFPLEGVERITAIAEGRLAAPSTGRHVPAWLRAIVARGLREDPSARWPSVDAIVAAIVGRRRRWRRTAVPLALVLVAGGAAAAVVLGGSSSRTSTTPQSPATVIEDPRGECNCPYSACYGYPEEAPTRFDCLSTCRYRGYTMGADIPGVNVHLQQEAVLGASGNGDTILYLTGQRCALDRIILARRRDDASFATLDVTDQIDRTRVAIFEGCCTLSFDGQTLVLSNATGTGFVQARVDDDRLRIVDEAQLASLIPPPIAGEKIRHPVLSADELSLYFRIDDLGSTPGETGPADGNYVATRADRSSPFRDARRLAGRARFFESVSGISSDGLTLFMTSEFRTYTLVRRTTADAFGEPTAMLTPWNEHTWRAVPLADCSRIITTATPGGCESERIIYLEALRDRE